MIRRCLAAIVFLCLAVPAAQAAQDASVTVEQAAIREMPAIDAKIIETKPVGSVIHISSFAKDGWYKVKSSLGQYGWIWQGDLSLQSFSSDARASNLQLPEHEHEHRDYMRSPLFFIRGSLGAGTMFTGIGQIAPDFDASLFAGAQVGVRLFEDLRFMLRLQTYSDAFTIAGFSSPTAMTASGTALMIGLEQDFSTGQGHKWAVGFYAGENLSSTVTALVGPIAPSKINTAGQGNVTKAPANTADVTINSDNQSVVISKTGYPVLLTFSYERYLSRWFSLLAEVGFFYDYIAQTSIPNYGSQHISVFGPVAAASLQFSF